MAPQTVELVALGPPVSDPYAPAAAAWAVARAYAQRGASVHVLFPQGTHDEEPPTGIRATPVPLPLKRPGAASEEAEFASRVGRHLRPEADLVVRDPVGVGPLGVHGHARRAVLVGLARGVELAEFDRERTGRPGAGFVDRLDGWRDRRVLRRLERAALEEPAALLCGDPAVAEALSREYRIPPARLRRVLLPVPDLPTPPTRPQARAALGIPPDVPVVVVPTATAAPDEAGVDRGREAFRRVRPFFPGARLIIVGAVGPTDPGVVSVTGRDGPSFAAALAAADVALVVPTRAGFDPGIVFAARAGCATIAYRSAAGPLLPESAVRTVSAEDPGDLASALAELVADLGAARELAARGQKFADGFRPEELLRAVDELSAARVG